jgi:hypothetical protein
VGALAACAVLLRPEPAGAAGNPRRLAFPPVIVGMSHQIEFNCFNSSTQPIPPFTVVFLNYAGSELSSKTVDSLPPGYSGGHYYFPPEPTVVSALVTFASPQSGQRLPNPICGAVSVYEGNSLRAVYGPAR